MHGAAGAEGCSLASSPKDLQAPQAAASPLQGLLQALSARFEFSYLVGEALQLAAEDVHLAACQQTSGQHQLLQPVWFQDRGHLHHQLPKLQLPSACWKMAALDGRKMAKPNAALTATAMAHSRASMGGSWRQLELPDPERQAQQQSPAWHQPLSPDTQTRLSPETGLSPAQDGARTSAGELEQGQHSTGPTLGLGGRVHQHAQGCACQQPRILVQDLDLQEGKGTTQNTI